MPRYEVTIDIDHPIYNECQVTIEAECETEEADPSVGISGGIDVLDFKVLEINRLTPKLNVLKSVESYMKSNGAKYKDLICEEIFEGRAE